MTEVAWHRRIRQIMKLPIWQYVAEDVDGSPFSSFKMDVIYLLRWLLGCAISLLLQSVFDGEINRHQFVVILSDTLFDTN
jgi:hypothetical protein